MPNYLIWKKQIITDFSDKNINTQYNNGFVFGRVEKGMMTQTRSVRIDLSKFELNSENKRILRKTEEINLEVVDLPLKKIVEAELLQRSSASTIGSMLKNYHWSIGKLAKNFYDTKFGKKTFSAFKIKELLTDKEKSNFNKLYIYISLSSQPKRSGVEGSLDKDIIGYCICMETDEIIHYSYPFYKLEYPNKNIGMGMMARAVARAKDNNKKYIYLGSAQRPTDTYKMQFKGLEWFDGKEWKDDIKELKKTLKNSHYH